MRGPRGVFTVLDFLDEPSVDYPTRSVSSRFVLEAPFSRYTRGSGDGRSGIFEIVFFRNYLACNLIQSLAAPTNIRRLFLWWDLDSKGFYSTQFWSHRPLRRDPPWM